MRHNLGQERAGAGGQAAGAGAEGGVRQEVSLMMSGVRANAEAAGEVVD